MLGAKGRMGGEVCRAVEDAADLELVARVGAGWCGPVWTSLHDLFRSHSGAAPGRPGCPTRPNLQDQACVEAAERHHQQRHSIGHAAT